MSKLQEIHRLATAGEMVVFFIQVKACYSEPELEVLLETMERRGASYHHMGDGRYRVEVSAEYLWLPFYQTIRDCGSVSLTDFATVNQRRTILIEPEG